MAERSPRSEARIQRVLALLMCAMLLIIGCTRRDEGPTIVTFWVMGREAELIGDFIVEFEHENPGIRVDIQQIPWTAAHEKLLTAFAADALPDICQLGNTWIPEFAALDTLEPLQTYVDGSRTVDRTDYFPGIWQTNVIGERLLGVPWYVDTRVIFYRKDLLAKAGIKRPPATWAEWESAMVALKREAGPRRYAIMLPLNEFEQLLSLALQQDDPLLRDEGNYGNFRSPGFRRSLAFYANMFEQGWAPPMSETQISNVWDEFFNGFFAFYISGPWNIREFRKRVPAGLENAWTTAPLPGPDGLGAGIAGGTSLVLFRGSPHKREAWKLVEFLSRPEIQQRFHAKTGNLPPRRRPWQYPALVEDEYARAFRDQLERVKPVPKVLEWERIVQEMRLASERVVRGGESQQDAVRDLDARVDEILEKRRWMHRRDTRIAGAQR